MYIVRYIKSKKIVHINPAPLEQNLTAEDIYYQFNAKTMEIGKTDLEYVPESFMIDENGNIIETIAETSGSDAAAAQTNNLPLTLAEQIAAGLITLSPYEKLEGEGLEAKIVYKTLSEQVADGLLTLQPNQKISGTGHEETIELKTVKELLQDRIITLDDIPKMIENGETTLSLEELFNEELITFAYYQELKIKEFSDLSLTVRNQFIPDYKIQNALLVIYDEQTTANIKYTVETFRNEFYRLKSLVETAKNLTEVLAIQEKYPREILIFNNGE
jgi:hypothetical protein